MMRKDPQASRDGAISYDLLAEAGVGPGSSMKEILDASYLLMEQGRWSPEVRGAWDELRTIERRLAVDFLLCDLLYDTDIGAEAANARQAILAALRQQSRTSPAELCDLNGELHEITLGSLAAAGTTAFDRPPPLPGPDMVEFDR